MTESRTEQAGGDGPREQEGAGREVVLLSFVQPSADEIVPYKFFCAAGLLAASSASGLARVFGLACAAGLAAGVCGAAVFEAGRGLPIPAVVIAAAVAQSALAAVSAVLLVMSARGDGAE